jgi:two-component system, LytTR family, response regulator
MIKAIIIDDEKHCIITLNHLLSQVKDLTVVATTQNSIQAKELIEKHDVDLVFLDIEMPEMNGFDVVNQFDNVNFKVIFTTAYDQYALKALRLNALDYLLKPIDLDDVNVAIQKFRDHSLHISKEQVQNLKMFSNGKVQETIAISSQEGLCFVKIEDIMYLEASSNYTYIIMNNNTKHLASKTMQTFEEVLDQNDTFFKCHKSYIINLKFIKQYIRGEGGELIMIDAKSIPVSRTRKQDFLNLFKKI